MNIRFVLSMYVNEPCRVCGKPIMNPNKAVFAGYSQNNTARSAHKDCFKRPKKEWMYK